MYDRAYNFNAGPAVLPEAVLEKAHKPWFNYENSGMAVMEMSHRSKEYTAIHERALANVKELMSVPDNYSVLLLQGGASMQFCMIPMNLAGKDGKVDMLQTGSWTKKATAEAEKVTTVNIAASTADDNFIRLPAKDEMKLSADASYVHLCSNNTIFGTQYKDFPDTGNVTLVADMSSDIMSRPVDVSKFGVIFAGAQKNLGPSGVTLVIIRNDLLENGPSDIPKILQYRTHADANSLYNTPPTFGIYMLSLVTDWVKEQGGLAAMQEHNAKKAKILYDCIADNDFYHCPIAEADRSDMNVVFRIKAAVEDESKASLEADFVAQATEAKLVGLKGHRSIGGLRASIYNSHPVEGVEALVDFMQKFASKNG